MMGYRGELNKFDAENESVEEFVTNILNEIEDNVNGVLRLLEDYKLEEAMGELRMMSKKLY